MTKSSNLSLQKSPSRKRWIQFHAYLSVFFFPFAIVYTITGALYIWGDLKTSHKDQVTLYDLKPNAPNSLQDIESLIRKHCEINSWEIPNGALELGDKAYGWGSKKSIHIKYRQSGSTKGKAYLTYTKVTLYGRLLNFHKAKGGTFLDILGTSFALLLIVSYLSGIYLAFKSRELRNKTLIAFVIGFTALVLAVFLGF